MTACGGAHRPGLSPVRGGHRERRDDGRGGIVLRRLVDCDVRIVPSGRREGIALERRGDGPRPTVVHRGRVMARSIGHRIPGETVHDDADKRRAVERHRPRDRVGQERGFVGLGEVIPRYIRISPGRRGEGIAR